MSILFGFMKWCSKWNSVWFDAQECFWLWDTRLFRWKRALLRSCLFLSKICWFLRLARVRWILRQGRDELNKRGVQRWTEQRLLGAGRWRAGSDRARRPGPTAGAMASRTQTVLFPVSTEDTSSSVPCQAAPRCHFKRLNDFLAAAGRAQGREAIGLRLRIPAPGPAPSPPALPRSAGPGSCSEGACRRERSASPPAPFGAVLTVAGAPDERKAPSGLMALVSRGVRALGLAPSEHKNFLGNNLGLEYFYIPEILVALLNFA